ncbi:MAG: polyamine aminopropyltransferase [Pseudomonadota bacterium]|nr:polyamine aminopropyltransferase [Pseudomonadota bacterium]
MERQRTGTAAAPSARVLFLSTILIATCGLVYELVAGALASYLLGDSVFQFSTIIGAYLTAMGIGSWLSRYLERDLVARFVEVEIAVALIGGFEAPILFAGFTYTPGFRAVLYIVVGLVGIGVGLELPLLIRILESRTSLKELVARVLALDYVGALVASLLFPLFFLPMVGLLRTSLVLGLVNALVALWTTFLFEAPAHVLTRLRVFAGAAVVVLAVALGLAGEAEKRMEADLFADPVVMSIQTSYQRLVLTHAGGDTRLFIDGALQFSSVDEYRYHEALVHPPMAAVANPERVLVMGGGDGLAVREVLRHPEVTSVVLVDLDPEMTRLFAERSDLAALNGGALSDPRVTIVNTDAFGWVRNYRGPGFDVVISDFPDPNNFGLGKLYSLTFYRLLTRVLAPGAAISVQATSPLFSPQAYGCIVETMREAGLAVRPYHAYVPAFGEWGFVLAGLEPIESFRPLPAGLRFLDADTLATLFHFPIDLTPKSDVVNRLDNQLLVRLYAEDWREMAR